MSFQERFQMLIPRRGLAEFARKSNLSVGALRRYESGGSPGIDHAVAISKAAGVSLEWLATGEGPMSRSHEPPLNETEHVLIPRYDIFASAGIDVLEVFEEHVLDHTAFRRDWLVGTMRLDPEKLAIIMVDGDSMIPTLQPGDFILIDLREAGRLRSDAVYVVRVEGALLVKRVQVGSDGRLDVWSDNPSYKPWTYTAEQSESLRVKIVGRVVWAGKRM